MTPRPYGDNFVLAVRKYLNDNSLKSLGQINAEVLADIAQRFQDHWALQQKSRKRSGDATPEEIAIYEAYPRRVGRDSAVLAIRNALRQCENVDLLQKVQKYGLSVARWPAGFRYKEGRDTVPYPASWFNAGRYLDDPKEWLPAGMFTREDDADPVGRVATQSLTEPTMDWREAVKADEDLAIFAGRDWDTINPHYKKLIVKLCTT